MTTSTASDPTSQNRGLALGLAGQATIVGAWLLALFSLASGVELAYVLIAASLVGFVLSVVSFFLLRPRWGPLGPAAGWTLLGGLILALGLFVVVPGDREWGKLAATVIAVAGLAVTTSAAHLVAGLGLYRSGQRTLGMLAAGFQGLALLIGVIALAAQSQILIGACIAMLLGHASLLIGFFTMRHAPAGRLTA